MFENSRAVELAVGRSTVRQRILWLLMDESSGRLHLREIQRRAGTSPGTASRELAKLVAAGLVEREAEGNQVYFRAATSPFATMLRSVIVAMPAPPVRPRPARVTRAPGGPPDDAGPGGPAAGDDMVSTPSASAAMGALDGAATEPATAHGTPGRQAEEAPADPPTGPAALPDGADDGADLGADLADPQTPRVVRPASPAPAARPDPLGLQIARRLADSVRQIYGPSLRGVYLYGRRANGPVPADVDVDVETIVVLDRVDHYGAELERTSQICAALSHEMNIVVSRIFVSEADWNGAPDGASPAGRAEALAV